MPPSIARQNLKWIVCVLVLLLGWSMARAQAVPESEKQKIEALINRVSDLKGAKFIRNGTEYDVNTAVRFLRGKWKANDKAVRSARDFVDKVASVSGTSGNPYHIRFQDGRETTSRNFLLGELKKLEA
jgi:hypothetical protein